MPRHARPRRFALSAAALLALLLGSGCTPGLQSAHRTRDDFSAGSGFMAACDGLGRSVQAAQVLDRQERIRVANAPTE
jgi:hypothetical protein